HGALTATPRPEELAVIEQFAGLNQTKIERLRAVADAATKGVLDPRRLRSQPTSDALAQLRTIDGVGPFSADLILARGAGAPDIFPASEQRLHQFMRSRYQEPDATVAELADIAQTWAPFRSWAAFQLRAAAERTR
ncbi:MAG: DNA-3-methyladenine glycosylase 2 family protein, partial [Acidimicrobiales bacterium]